MLFGVFVLSNAIGPVDVLAIKLLRDLSGSPTDPPRPSAPESR